MKAKRIFVEILNKRVNKRMGKEIPRKDIERGLKYIFLGLIAIVVLIIALVMFLCLL